MKKIIAIMLAVISVFSVVSMVGCNQPVVNPEVTDDQGNAITFEEVNETVYATQTVNIRSTMSTDGTANIVKQLEKGEEITRIGYNSEWSKVTYNGETCYIKTRYLSTTPVPADTTPGSTETNVPDESFDPVEPNELLYIYWENEQGPLSSGEVNVRDVPNWSAAPVAQLAIGTQVTRVAVYYEVDGEITGFSKIIYDGKTYYISNRALSEKDYSKEVADTTPAA